MEVELRGDEHAYEHGDDAKKNRGQHELAHDPVVVFDGYFLGHEGEGLGARVFRGAGSRNPVFAIDRRQPRPVIERQQGILLDAALVALGSLSKEEHRKENGEHQADKNGDGKDFHGW